MNRISREQRILIRAGLAQGLSTRDIARLVGCTAKTVTRNKWEFQKKIGKLIDLACDQLEAAGVNPFGDRFKALSDLYHAIFFTCPAHPEAGDEVVDLDSSPHCRICKREGMIMHSAKWRRLHKMATRRGFIRFKPEPPEVK